MKLGFIGMGNMATALVRGFVASGKIKGADVDPIEYFSKSALEALAKTAETLPIE